MTNSQLFWTIQATVCIVGVILLVVAMIRVRPKTKDRSQIERYEALFFFAMIGTLRAGERLTHHAAPDWVNVLALGAQAFLIYVAIRTIKSVGRDRSEK